MRLPNVVKGSVSGDRQGGILIRRERFHQDREIVRAGIPMVLAPVRLRRSSMASIEFEGANSAAVRPVAEKTSDLCNRATAAYPVRFVTSAPWAVHSIPSAVRAGNFTGYTAAWFRAN